MNNEHNFVLIVNEVQKQYMNLRTLGKNRETAIATIKHNYIEAMQDEDDSMAVMIGVVLSLCKKKELTKEIIHEARTMICNMHSRQNLDETMLRYIFKVEPLIDDGSLLGDEATYKQRMPYVPDWKAGDTFLHKITCPQAKKFGIEGWFVLFYKVDEFVDDFFQHRQMMYVSLCPPEAEHIDDAHIKKLGFLRMMEHDGKWDYLVQIILKNKKDELSYGLTKIGNFPNIPYPIDRADEDPLAAMPIFGYLKKTDTYPNYEDQICRLYRKNRRI